MTYLSRPGSRAALFLCPRTLACMKTLLLAAMVAVSAVACSSTSTSSIPPPAPASTSPPVPTLTPSQQQCHEHHGLPDRTCTPGAINLSVTQASITSTICKRGWTATVRPPESYTRPLKAKQIARYGYTDTSPAAYEEDHLVPLELGGSPANPANLWPEPRIGVYGSAAKDKVENAARVAVCDGRRTLAAMQHGMEVNWEALGRRLAASTPKYTPPPARTYTPAPTHTYAPAPVRTRTTAPPAHASCYPTTSTGHCYEAGEFCRTSDRNVSGVAGNGARITCRLDGDRYRWELS